MFELHVCQSGEWKRLKTFDYRHDAMSTAFQLERSRHYSGAKVFELVFDQQVLTTKKKLLHRWSEDDDARAAQREMEESFDRQRQHRRQIHGQRKIEIGKRKKQARNIIFLSSLFLIVVFGFAGILMLAAS